MVDKVDKPTPPPAYAVTGATGTKQDKPREERGQEDLPTFQRQKSSPFSEKFQGQGGYTKTVYVPLRQIQQLQYKRATPRQGIPTADADLSLRDGTKLENVSFLLHNWQDFMQIKNLKPGEIIPENFWQTGGDRLEVTVRSVNTSGPWNLKEIEEESQSPTGPDPDRAQKLKKWIGWGIAGLVLVGIILILVL